MTPEAVSDMLGMARDGGIMLPPDIAARRSVRADGPQCTWVLQSRCDPHWEPSRHIAALLDRLEPHAEALRELLGAKAVGTIRVAVLSSNDGLAVVCPADVARRLARLHLAVVVVLTPKYEWDGCIRAVRPPDACTEQASNGDAGPRMGAEADPNSGADDALPGSYM